MQNNKIMFVIPSLEGGGAERVATVLLGEFCKAKNVDTILVLFHKNIGYELPDNLKIICLNIGEYKNFAYTIIKFFLIIIKLIKILKRERPYSVLSFMDYANVIVMLSKIFSNIKTKVAVSVHSSPTLYLHKYGRNFWDKATLVLMRFLYDKANRIITVSEFIKYDLISNFVINQSKVTVIYNPVDLDKIIVSSGEEASHTWFRDNIPVILSAGRLSKEKGFAYLIKAFAIVRQKTNVRLMILGQGCEETFLRGLSSEAGVDKDVVFLGFKQNPFMYMKRATIYVLSSLYEGFPVSLVEAMACGIPVISTMYNPGFNELVENEKNGLLVPVADERALAVAMLRLLNNPEERRKYSAQAKESVRQFSIKQIVEQYKSVLIDVQNG